MSVLVILIPPRSRQAGRGAAEPASRPATEFDYVLSNDGVAVATTGRCAAALLPRADSVVAMLADADVSWHLVQVPKAPAAKLRAALAGAMEEALLDDEEALHFALPPGAVAGQPAAVAVMHRPWLVAALTELESGGRPVDRLVPASAPAAAASGHFFIEAGDAANPTLALLQATGVAVVRTGGALARALLPSAGTPLRWTATPAAAGAAERWLGSPVTVMSDAERALQAARSLWNLRQFDVAPHHRGTVALREGLRQLLSPQWRAMRWGLAALVAVQLVGLNAWAWRLQKNIDDKRAEMSTLLRATHPKVRAVFDPALQMQRESESLRAAAGRLGDADLESLLGAAAAAWPDGQGPVQTLRFEPGRLTLAATGFSEPQLAQFRERLRPAGFDIEQAEGRITLSRSGRAS